MPSKLIFLVPIFMSILWPFRQQCSLFIFRHLTSDTVRRITMGACVRTAERPPPYPGTTKTRRKFVPVGKEPWDVQYDDYQPIEYTSEKVLANPPWADVDDPTQIKHYNEIDGNIDRTSYLGKYGIDESTNRPKNPRGRTGLSGRGLLGRWGPNHAGDPIVTRWAKDQYEGMQKVLEVLLITRTDNANMALPGGMVDPGERALDTVKREFFEEALDSNAADKKQGEALFEHAVSVFQGYIDDPRNTDNSWMESEAFHVHDENGELTKPLNFKAGDDAKAVKWVRLDRELKLYASHKILIQKVIERLGAYQYQHNE